MSLQKLELIGLRGFATPQELAFAVPNGKLGSGLTTLVGPNNGGKSTVVEALRALAASSPQAPSQPQSFTEGRRNKHAGDKIAIQATDTIGEVGGLRTVESGGSETEWFPYRVDKKVFVLPSRRYFNPYFGKSTVTRDSYVANYGSPRVCGEPLDYFAYRLFQAQQQNRAAFDAILEEVIKPVPNWTIDQSDSGQYYLKVEKGGLSQQ